MGTSIVAVLLVRAGTAQAPNPSWVEIDRTARVVTEAGELLVRHRAVLEDDGASHEYTVTNLSFDPEGLGLVSLDLPLHRGVMPVAESMVLPEGWQLGAATEATADASAGSRWTRLRFAPGARDRFREDGFGVAIGETLTIGFRLPRGTRDGVPYSQEMARYGVVCPVSAADMEVDSPGEVAVWEFVALPPCAVVDVEPGEAEGGTPTYPLGTSRDDLPARFPDRPPPRVRLPDLTVTVETERALCGTSEDGTAWLHVPLTVENLGGAASCGFVWLHVETPLGTHERAVGPIDAGAGRELLLILHAASGLLANVGILAVVDAANDLGESDERNNVDVIDLLCFEAADVEPVHCGETVLIGCPNLTVTARAEDTACRESTGGGTTSLELLVGIGNHGTAGVPQGALLRVEGSFGNVDIPLRALPSGAQHAAFLSFTFDRSLEALRETAGQLGFQATLDPGNTVEECHESDNQALSSILCSD